MVGVVDFGAVFAGPFCYHWKVFVSFVSVVGDENLPCAPPGCSGAKVVRSYTLPLTTTQQSSAVECLLTSSTATFPSDDMIIRCKTRWYTERRGQSLDSAQDYVDGQKQYGRHDWVGLCRLLRIHVSGVPSGDNSGSDRHGCVCLVMLLNVVVIFLESSRCSSSSLRA